ncbi:methyl-accepting chemotaxis protein [Magnetovibrio sp. PR-2]|uniref:methyl-accepting chemotaxis protein n=1 Tax=Magnetovibrio sp. PR-2 TaxID=3120356 RepID=UPI002FCE22EC
MSGRDEFGRLGLMLVTLGLGAGALFPTLLIILGMDTSVVLSGRFIGSAMAVGLVAGLVNAMIVRKRMTTRLDDIHHIVDDVAAGVSPNSSLTDNQDAFGELARAIVTLEQHLAALQAEAVETVETPSTDDDEHNALLQNFELGVQGTMSDVRKDTQSIQDAARAMGESAESSLGQAHSAIALSDAAAQGVAAVAQSAETMSSNVQQLVERMHSSNNMSLEAVERVNQADTLVGELGEATSKIENVAELIIDIADQTNMLALNATIEAARAGDAGKGFAVVAGEVKSLATQTAKATDEISAHIGSIRKAGERARSAMEEVIKAIGAISDISNEVTQAADDQRDSVSEISVNARETADATGQSLSYIREVGDAIEETGFAAHEMLATVDDLARQLGKLSEQSDTFVDQIRKNNTQ